MGLGHSIASAMKEIAPLSAGSKKEKHFYKENMTKQTQSSVYLPIFDMVMTSWVG